MSSDVSSAPKTRNKGRITSLDGLRGIAALVVLLNHALLIFPSFSAAYQEPGSATPSSWAWWLTATPLVGLWSGTEAVRIFFILSGLVLALPLLGGATVDWKSWYPRRLLRLYVPTWVAVAIALALFMIIPRVENPAASSWINDHSRNMSVGEFIGPFTLLFGETGFLLSPLWSLKWEVVFSLLLPLYFWVMLRTRRHPLLQVCVLTVASLAGYVLGIDTLKYMPFFGFGILLAQNINQVEGVTRAWGRTQWAVVTAVSLVLLPAQHYRGLLSEELVGSRVLDILQALLFVPATIAAVGVVIICGWSPLAKKMLTLPAVQWLGTRSFSLYLIHETLVVSAAVAFGPSNLWLALPAILVVSLFAAEVFFRCVERPSHRLSKLGKKDTPPLVAGRGTHAAL
ncbi:acyltransferase family protein [Arthrobacter sp. AD-310]